MKIEPLDLCFNGKIEAPDPLDIAAKLNEVIEHFNCGESAIDKLDKLQDKSFCELSEEEQKNIISRAAKASNRDQRKLADKYKLQRLLEWVEKNEVDVFTTSVVWKDNLVDKIKSLMDEE
jgi:hypothetical protein